MKGRRRAGQKMRGQRSENLLAVCVKKTEGKEKREGRRKDLLDEEFSARRQPSLLLLPFLVQPHRRRARRPTDDALG